MRGRGLFHALELRCSRDAVVAAALDRDLWIYPAGSGPVPEVVMIAPAFVVSLDEIDQIVGLTCDAIEAVAT